MPITQTDEDLIDAYVRGAGDLTSQERERAEALIETDRAAFILSEFFRTFYEELESAEGDVHPRVEAFVRELAPVPRVVPLWAAPRLLARLRRTASDATAPVAFEEVKAIVLRSDVEHVVIQVLLDADGGAYRVHAVASDAVVSAHALLFLPEADARIPLDAHGRGRLERPAGWSLWTTNWTRDAAFYPVRFRRVFNVEALPSEPAELIPGFRLRIHGPGGDRFVARPAAGPSTARFVAVEWSGGERVIEAPRGEAVITLQESVRDLAVAVYG